jgi:Na+/melibiose symporter-like transporter
MNAFGTLLGGLLLSLVGYVPQATQDPNTLWWLVMLLGPLQAAVHLVGFVIFRRLRFGGEDVARVQQALKARQVATT